MHISKADLNLFIVFDAIYAEGGLTRASWRLNLSQPAVSHALSRLRRLFGDPLFERHGHSMISTSVAQRAIGPVRDALQQLETALNGAANFDPATAARRFTVGLRDHFEFALLPQLVHELAASAPNVSVEFVRAERRDLDRELSTGRLDMALDVPLPLAVTIARRTLGTERLVVVARKRHPRLRGDLDMSTYISLSHVQVSARRHGPSIEDFELARRGLRRKITIRCQHYFAACEIVRKSDLLLTMSERYARIIGRLVPNHVYAFPIDIPALETCLYWHARTDSDPANLWLRELIAKAIDEA